MDKRVFGGILTVLLFILVGCGSALTQYYEGYGSAFVRDGEGERPASQPAGDDVTVSRGLAAMMIALSFADPAEIDRTQRIITFSDTEPDDWFDKYINKSYYLGYLSGFGDEFRPHDPLTLQQAQFILDGLDPYNPIRIQLTDENRNMAISYALWVNLYIQMLENISGSAGVTALGLRQTDAVVLLTSDFNQNLPTGNIVTSGGRFAVQGLDFTPYLDKEVALLLRGSYVIAVAGISNPVPTLRNAFLAERGRDTITIFAGGAGRTFDIDPRLLTTLPAGRIVDVTIENGRAVAVQVFDDNISGVVKEIGNGFIEIDGMGRVSTRQDFAIYSMLSTPVALGRTSQITIGYDVADFTLRDGEISAAVILRRPVPTHIRVVLSTTGFGSRIHSTVELRSAGGLAVHTYDGITNFGAGEVFRLGYQNAHLLGGGRISIHPLGDDKIEIMTISRNWSGGANPQYRGFLEISGRDGGFVIVNQLPFEQYLYAVIPSEMPTSFGLEPAKVQAVTARSYAYNQFFANRFYRYGANICDSVMTQVYNNIPETELARQATRATAGMFLTHNGQVVSTNYFSTSSGHTADRGDVWVNFATGDLDAETPVYLSGRPQNLALDPGDLSQEHIARAFFMDTTITAYDDQSPWFRWNFHLTNDQLTRIINQNLPALSQRSPQHFAILGQQPTFPPQTVYTIGDFVDMEVLSRGRGGNIGLLQINGTTNSITVRTEYLIRRLLTPSLPEGIALNRHNNSAPVNNHFILPSTFVTFEATNGGMTFHGGGFGHGVGMSQHGAYGMARRGYDFAQILVHFYPGTQLLNLTNN
ncbi:MAG: SpoIID/LytB domain-containing protein [Defluviitaleaceae bacterium]|nr:SpoIID/LytB domain-containing protein [Defluviitaleaceae bacterium]